MEEFWLQGVVKNGQVVLATPLDLPDGTLVTVRDYEPIDERLPIGPSIVMTDEEFAEFTLYFTKKKDNKDFPEFVERVKRAQTGRTHPRRRAS